jgi:PAS domain S-box-containing protein
MGTRRWSWDWSWGVTALAVAGAAGSARAVRRELHQRDQVIAASALTSEDWVWETDADGCITYSNAAADRFLGLAPDDLLGVSTCDLLFDDAARVAFRAVRDAHVQRGTGWHNVPLDWRHRDGSRVTLQESALPLWDRRGALAGLRGARRPVPTPATERGWDAAARRRVTAVVADRDVDVAAQPIVSLTSGRVLGVEALARFRDGRSPDLWFQDARLAGQSLALDQLTFESALPLLEVLPEPVYLSVNAGPELLLDLSFRERLLDRPIRFDRLVVEITEHARVPDYEALNAALEPLRRRGARFAIDDTGAGYASLAHVLQLHPDIIKLDRALIADLNSDPARRSLVTALVLLALDIGATVTGEGAETDSQLDTLATLGVDQAQGYGLARPTTDHDEWEDWWGRTWSATVHRQRVPSAGS